MALKHKSLFKQNLALLQPEEILYFKRPSEAKPHDKFKLKIVTSWGRDMLAASLERLSREPRAKA